MLTIIGKKYWKADFMKKLFFIVVNAIIFIGIIISIYEKDSISGVIAYLLLVYIIGFVFLK